MEAVKKLWNCDETTYNEFTRAIAKGAEVEAATVKIALRDAVLKISNMRYLVKGAAAVVEERISVKVTKLLNATDDLDSNNWDEIASELLGSSVRI